MITRRPHCSVFQSITVRQQRWGVEGQAGSLRLLDRCLGLEDLHDNLLLLDEERSHDAFAHTLVAARAAVRPRHGLEALGHARPLNGPRRCDAMQLHLAISTLRDGAKLLDVVVHQSTAGCLDYSATIGVGVVTQPTAERQSLSHASAVWVCNRQK